VPGVGAEVREGQRPTVRIAIVADAASINVRDWARELGDAGATVDVLSFVDDPTGTLDVHRLTAPSFVGERARYLLAGPSVRRLVARIAPDVVVGFYVTGYGTVARQSRHPVVVQVSVGNDTLVNPPGTLTHRMAERNLRRARLVVAWGPHIVDAVRSFGVPDERIVSLWAGIPLRPYPPGQVPTGGPTRWITTRGLDPYYRHDVLIRAVAAAGTGTSTPRLTLVGGGPIATELGRLAAELGVADGVVFTGRVDDDEKVRLLYGSGVYVSACPTDGVSASLLEAMAAGLFPVVVDYVANRSWIEDGVNGLLVDGSVDSYVAAFRRIQDQPDLLARARSRNREIVDERADARRNAVRFLDRFERLLAEG